MPFSNRPWSDFGESDYTLEQWHRACLIHLHDGTPTSKAQCKLPVREPDGTLNRNAIYAAAAALAGARAPLDAPAEQKRRAARKLIELYREMGEIAPESTYRIAGLRPVKRDA